MRVGKISNCTNLLIGSEKKTSQCVKVPSLVQKQQSLKIFPQKYPFTALCPFATFSFQSKNDFNFCFGHDNSSTSADFLTSSFYF